MIGHLTMERNDNGKRAGVKWCCVCVVFHVCVGPKMLYIAEVMHQQALIQDQISTSPSPRAVDATRGLRTDFIT